MEDLLRELDHYDWTSLSEEELICTLFRLQKIYSMAQHVLQKIPQFVPVSIVKHKWAAYQDLFHHTAWWLNVNIRGFGIVQHTLCVYITEAQRDQYMELSFFSYAVQDLLGVKTLFLFYEEKPSSSGDVEQWCEKASLSSNLVWVKKLSHNFMIQYLCQDLLPFLLFPQVLISLVRGYVDPFFHSPWDYESTL